MIGQEHDDWNGDSAQSTGRVSGSVDNSCIAARGDQAMAGS